MRSTRWLPQKRINLEERKQWQNICVRESRFSACFWHYEENTRSGKKYAIERMKMMIIMMCCVLLLLVLVLFGELETEKGIYFFSLYIFDLPCKFKGFAEQTVSSRYCEHEKH